jgi:hypothetical protein
MGQISIGRTGLAIVVLGATLLVAPVVLAQSGGDYDLSWSTVDGGGYTFSTGGDYQLGGTAGQHDAGCASGGNYTVCGGFWPGSEVDEDYYGYLPLALRRY